MSTSGFTFRLQAAARALPALAVLALPCSPARAQAPSAPAAPAATPPASDSAAAEAAPTLPALLTLEEALRIFRARGFDALVAEANVRGAEGDFATASALPNPALLLAAGRNFSCAATQDCSIISYSASVFDSSLVSNLLTGKRGLRKEVAAAALAAVRGSRDDARRTLELQLKQQFFLALLAGAQLENARAAQESNARTRELNERRYALGAISEAELSKTEVAALESDQVLDQAAQSLRAAKVGLAFLLGFRQLVPEFSLDPKELDYALPGPVARATREALLQDALERRPDLRATLAQEERAQAALSLARRNRFPDVGLGFSYSANGSGDSNISPPNASISLSFAPPLFYLQAGEIRRAEADLVTQRVLHQKAQALVVSDVETAFAQLQAQRRLVERMQGALLARAQRTRDLVQVQYEKGAASLLELLDAQRTFTAVRGEYLQNLTSYWIAVAALEAAAAMDLSR